MCKSAFVVAKTSYFRVFEVFEVILEMFCFSIFCKQRVGDVDWNNPVQF
jgi:hypothetical protein